ncbi:WSC domain-containing protein [Bisporella sp. PMI_857]|nr:WSC domain-containing protein [Bisporella sp. PMI_857]
MFKSLLAASAAAALFAGVSAGEFGLIGKRTGGPGLPSCTDYTPFVYAGCFSDSGNPRTLIYDSGLDTQSMTVEKCVAFCKGNSYEYAGLEYYGQCFCGASVYGTQVDESNCNFPCTGNQTEVCGGNSIISIYQDPTFPTVDDNDISDYKALGCYSEGTSGRSLVWRQDQVAEADLTINKCLAACKKGGYAFAGVEYGQECYCGVVLGNGTALVDSAQCDMPCTGNAAGVTDTCGGRGTLNLFIASDLESSEPCGGPNPPVSSSTTSVPTTSTTSSSTSSSTTTTSPTTTSTTYTTPTSTTSSSTTSPTSTRPTTSPTSTRSTTSTTVTTPPTTTKPTTTVSLCTSTYTVKPTPTCEYKCGNWCSTPLPNFSDATSCLKAVGQCKIQLLSCFLQAGFPANLDCWAFSDWCQSVTSYCSSSCPGSKCSISGCKDKNPPPNPNPPKPTVTSSVYTCVSSTSAKPTTSKTSTSKTSTSTSCVPIPTQVNVCKQPHSPSKGYSTDSPVGGISLPCLTCNNLKSDYDRGLPFKLYTDPDTRSCKSYSRGGSNGPSKACKDACDAQYAACQDTYVNACRSNPKNKQKNKNKLRRGRYDGGDNYDTANKKCKWQLDDCYLANSQVSDGGRCGSYNGGWY